MPKKGLWSDGGADVIAGLLGILGAFTAFYPPVTDLGRIVLLVAFAALTVTLILLTRREHAAEEESTQTRFESLNRRLDNWTRNGTLKDRTKTLGDELQNFWLERQYAWKPVEVVDVEDVVDGNLSAEVLEKIERRQGEWTGKSREIYRERFEKRLAEIELELIEAGAISGPIARHLPHFPPGKEPIDNPDRLAEFLWEAAAYMRETP